MTPLVYLAGPYSHPDPCINTHEAIKLADSLLDVCVPVVPHLTHLWHTVSPKSYATWMEIDQAMLERCDALLRFGGNSHGADAEVKYAGLVALPVFFDIETLRDWLASGRQWR